MHDDSAAGRSATVALTAGTAVTLTPAAIDLIARLGHRTTAERIEVLKGAVRDGLIGGLGRRQQTATRFPDSSPSPDVFKDK